MRAKLGDRRLPERFWRKVSVDSSGCWLWTASRKPAGYGEYYDGTRVTYAHRVAYRELVGPIAAGLELDHLCRNRACCNPAHLEAVTHAKNMQRGVTGLATGAKQRAKTHCPSGHAYTAENTYSRRDRVSRSCRACHNTRMRLKRAEERRSGT